MKNKAVTVLISGTLLLAFLSFLGCMKQPTLYVVDDEDTLKYICGMNLYFLNVVPTADFLDTMESPAAGIPEADETIPSAIIHYLMLSKENISGLVWKDNNGNRLIDPGEKGVQNVRVYVDNDNSESFSYGDSSGFTDFNGQYTIPKIKTGTHNVYIDLTTLSQGYEITTTHPITVNLTANQDADDTDFGMRESSAAISGVIWDQTDNAAIPGVVVYIDLNNNDEISPGEPYGTTDSNGNYIITNLPTGDFKAHLNNGTLDVKYHRIPVAGSNPTPVTLVQGGTLTVSMTYIHKAAICGTLEDTSGKRWENITLYIDLNRNGTYDEGEPTAVTDASGNYCFNELLPGTYTVLLLTEGFDVLLAPGTITVGEGEDYSGVNFSIQARPIHITGIVWDDENANGEKEPEEKGIAGVTVFLDANNNRVAEKNEQSIASDDTGIFSFIDLTHGEFYIRVNDEELRTKYIPTTAPNPVYREISPGETYDEAKFGYRRKLTPVNTLTYPTRLSWGSDGNVYVSDNRVGSVFIYDSNLNLHSELRGLDKPLAVSSDGDGNMYVGNRGRKNVEVYDSGGSLLMKIGEGQILTPNDIALDRDNNVYILDSTNSTVLVYSPDGTFITPIGSSLDYRYPVSIAINYRDDGTGTEIAELYIADQPSCSIKVYTLDGTYMRSIGRCGSMYTRNWDGLFSGLMAVDVDQAGNVHGLDNNLNIVQVFDPQSGAFLRSYNAYPDENEYRINLQTDISINPADSRSVISNVGTKRIEEITTAP